MSGKPLRGFGKSQPKPKFKIRTQEYSLVRKSVSNGKRELKIAPNIIKIKSDNRPYVKVVIGGREVTALLDSGANISILGQLDLRENNSKVCVLS